jgi:antitoxin MazE
MKAKIIQIGNSKGLRLPKSVLERCQFSDQVELEVDGNILIIKSLPQNQEPRKDWADAFLRMHSTAEDELLLPDSFEDDEDFEW